MEPLPVVRTHLEGAVVPGTGQLRLMLEIELAGDLVRIGMDMIAPDVV